MNSISFVKWSDNRFSAFLVIVVRFMISAILLTSFINAQVISEVFNRYTHVNQLGLTVTNYGVLGNGWNYIGGQILPSSMYKQYPESQRQQVEHFANAGLWIGGKVNDQIRVSTAILDGSFEIGELGYEMFPTSNVGIRSNFNSVSDDTLANYYSPDAISHLDFLTNFNDYSRSVSNHVPLGIDIYLESYSWENSVADDFVILDYQITNSSQDTITDIYAGIWTNAAVANMNYTNIYTPGGGFNWYDNLNGYDESTDAAGFGRDIAYQYDADGDNGWALSYIGITMLGSNVPYNHLDSYYHQWVWSNSTNSEYPDYVMPLTDNERYESMKNSVPKGPLPGTTGTFYNGYPDNPDSWLFQLSAGPLGSVAIDFDSASWALPPGEKCNIVFAVVAAPWNGTGDDTPLRRGKLLSHADYAQQIYNGEDINRNNVLDSGEDLDQDGIIDRYLLPPEPPQNVSAEWTYPTVKLTWETSNQAVIGYDIYRSISNGEFVKINSTIVSADFYVDSMVTQNAGTAYYIVCKNNIGWESAPSKIVKDYSSPPSVNFINGSIPSVSDIGNNTYYSFPTQTFAWEMSDVDGFESISNVYYCLDDSSEWIVLPPNHLSITLKDIPAGNHIFYLKVRDNFDMYSNTISFPPIDDPGAPDIWIVKQVIGNVLLVDDFSQDIQNQSLNWYSSILDSLVGVDEYSVWEIGNRLPYSAVDIMATLNYFDNIIWFAAYTGHETYTNAGSSIMNYLMGGGNLFINVTEITSTTFEWFPLNSTNLINPGGRLMPGKILYSSVWADLDLSTSALLPIRIKSFDPDITQFAEIRNLYNLQAPESGDEWSGTPNVCSVGQFLIPSNQLLSGKVILMSFPMHNGYSPILDGNNSDVKFIRYLLDEEFTPRMEINPMYPGDTDNNGIVNELDILPIGLHFLQSSVPRSEITVQWAPNEVPLWNYLPTTYADANGDGTVDEKDVIAIGVNWHAEHSIFSERSFSVNPKDITSPRYYNSIRRIYNSLVGESEAVLAMKDLLESILENQIPKDYKLYQNYPNPFNPITTIRFNLPLDSEVTVTLYNVIGQVTEVLVNRESYKAGLHELQYSPDLVGSGVYFCTIVTDHWSATNKMVIIK